jgi:hypothetical protein
MRGSFGVLNCLAFALFASLREIFDNRFSSESLALFYHTCYILNKRNHSLFRSSQRAP